MYGFKQPSHGAFIQSLRNADFINWQVASYLTIYKVLYNKKLTPYEALNHFVYFYFRIVTVLIGHLINHMISTELPSCDEQHDIKGKLIGQV